MLALELPGIIISFWVTAEGNKASKDQDEGTEIGWHPLLPHLPIRYSTICTGHHNSGTFLSRHECSCPFLVPLPQPSFEISLFIITHVYNVLFLLSIYCCINVPSPQPFNFLLIAFCHWWVYPPIPYIKHTSIFRHVSKIHRPFLCPRKLKFVCFECPIQFWV